MSGDFLSKVPVRGDWTKRLKATGINQRAKLRKQSSFNDKSKIAFWRIA